MPIFVGAIITCESCALYILITSTDKVPIPIIFLFIVVAIDVWILIVGPMKIMAKPYVESVEFLNSLKTENTSKWTKKFARSCTPAKIMLGDGKFFDAGTPLVVWRQTIELLVAFLLM